MNLWKRWERTNLLNKTTKNIVPRTKANAWFIKFISVLWDFLYSSIFFYTNNDLKWEIKAKIAVVNNKVRMLKYHPKNLKIDLCDPLIHAFFHIISFGYDAYVIERCFHPYLLIFFDSN